MMNMARKDEPGWIPIAMHDPVGRRGLWYRLREGFVVELCSGREGEDAFARIKYDPYSDLVQVLDYARYAYELAQEEKEDKND
jgi:hypothetical protein